MNGAGKILSGLAGAVYLVLLAPVIVVFFIAFSADNFIVFPPSGFSTRWFERLWGHERLMSGLRISFIVAIIVSLLSLLIGVPAAYALARGEFTGRGALRNFFVAPLLLPTLVSALALLMAFQPLKLTASYPGLVMAHMTVTLPFVIRMVATSLETLPLDVEQAAATLGATPLRVFRRVTLPLALPGLIAASALSFLLSFDETVISLFLSGPVIATLPVEMVRYIEGRSEPLIAALAVTLVAGTLVIVLAVDRIAGLTKTMSR